MADSNTCFVCDKAFQLRKTLYAHIRKMHDVEPNTEGTIKCPQDDCSHSLNTLACLRAHVEEKHMVRTADEKIVFQSMDDFLKWKSKEEKLARCSFVMHGGAKHVKGATKITYVCHRSGIFISRSKGKRLLKSQGSNKMGGHCTSAIEVSQEKNGTCTCVYFKTHFGHELNIGFLHLSKSEREIIAGEFNIRINVFATAVFIIFKAMKFSCLSRINLV
ncbi:uncharacterized protein LOC124594344 [Schistocerca americana]|uniref:uncharacterized protein LOC124594344 n=1 Tax=Schistocerca americana TaxID=7009 RepID=UPI001F4F44E2|nr:uncharacterized protein LOC124594344 [Schistocerca americana]